MHVNLPVVAPVRRPIARRLERAGARKTLLPDRERLLFEIRDLVRARRRGGDKGDRAE